MKKAVTGIKKAWQSTKGGLVFFQEILKSPKHMGAFCPSSPKLAKAMAKEIPLPLEGIVIELGGGTGVITQAILDRGVPKEKLYVVERSKKLCDILRRRFPGVNILEADAVELSKHIPQGARVDAVVSGLPLRSLPKQVVAAIGEQLQVLMPDGCVLIQFTYDLRLKEKLQLPINRLRSKVIWQNIPPARVDVSKLSTA